MQAWEWGVGRAWEEGEEDHLFPSCGSDKPETTNTWRGRKGMEGGVGPRLTGPVVLSGYPAGRPELSQMARGSFTSQLGGLNTRGYMLSATCHSALSLTASPHHSGPGGLAFSGHLLGESGESWRQVSSISSLLEN